MNFNTQITRRRALRPLEHNPYEGPTEDDVGVPDKLEIRILGGGTGMPIDENDKALAEECGVGNENELTELETLESIRERIASGETLPARLVRISEIMDGIDHAALFGAITDTNLQTHLKDVIPGIKRFIIQTDEFDIAIHYNPARTRVVGITYPVEGGRRLHIEELLHEEEVHLRFDPTDVALR